MKTYNVLDSTKDQFEGFIRHYKQNTVEELIPQTRVVAIIIQFFLRFRINIELTS